MHDLSDFYFAGNDIIPYILFTDGGLLDGRPAPATKKQKEWRSERRRDERKLALVRESAIAHNNKIRNMIEDTLKEQQIYRALKKQSVAMRAADPTSLPPVPPSSTKKNVVRVNWKVRGPRVPMPLELNPPPEKEWSRFRLKHSVVESTYKKIVRKGDKKKK